jgi:hypothetical protein
MRTYIIIASMFWALLCNAQPLTLTMQECRDMALAHSEDLKMTANDVSGAELDYKIARNSRLPQLSGSAMGMYMAPDTDLGGMTLSMKGTWTAGLTLTQPIYAGGKITSGIKLAKMGVEANRQQQRATRATIIADADNAYWTFIAVREKQQMLLSMLEYINSIYTQVKNSVDVEMATSADLLRVEAKRSDFNYQLEQANNGLEMCRVNLCNMIGVDFNTEIQTADTIVAIDRTISGDFSYDLVSNRPEYKLLQSQIDISREQIKMVRADYLPTLAFSAGYSYYGNLKLKGFADDGTGNMMPFSQNYKDGSFSMMLSLSIPIWNWGEGHKKVKKQKLAVENARLNLEKNSRLMSIELRNAYNNLQSSISLIATAEAGERNATEALRVMTDRYEVGMCTLTDLLEAQSQWHSARSNVIEARTQYKIYETDYRHAAGMLE